MDITIIKSNRKTISIQVHPDMTVTVRAPKRAAQGDIERFIREKESWIKKHLEQLEQRKRECENSQMPQITEAMLQELADRALKVIPERVALYAPVVGVTYGRITIRNQKTRWGSCSSKGNLNFNCLLMLAPPDVVDYVVVHELCHRRQMNHSKAFWSEVSRVLPDYKIHEKWLKTEGSKIMIAAFGK